MPDTGSLIAALYEARFDVAAREARARVWRVLCDEFFQRYVSPQDTVLDLGAGACEFINNVRAGTKLAIDESRDLARHAAPGVRCHQGSGADLSWLEDESVDVVFASNVFEHFSSRDVVLAALREIHRVLRAGGLLLVLQPNVRYAYREYWDFFDHNLAFSDRAMIEALRACGFTLREARPRFLPYSTTGCLPTWPMLVRLYLRLPMVHRLLGKQMFLVGERFDRVVERSGPST